VPDKNRFEIEFELSGGETVPARLISDGTLRVLALLTALRLEPRPSLIGIEEPENGIYPGRLRALVELLRRESEWPLPDELLPGAPQILVTTHSPVILAALRNHPQHLRFVDTVHRGLRRVTRARAVGEPSKDPRRLVSPRDIDRLLHAVSTEDPEWAG
jgi:predicted ATPase